MDVTNVNKNTLDGRVKDIYRDIHTMFLARIDSYDPIECSCSVQPLEKQQDYYGNYIDSALIIKVPVSLAKTKDFAVRLPYTVGDVVLVGVTKHALDDLIITGEPEINTLKEQGREFNINDAIVLTGVLTEEEPQMPSFNSEDFLVHNRTTGHKIVFKKDGEVEINNGTIINIKPNGEVTVSASSSVTVTTPIFTIDGSLAVTQNATVNGLTSTGSLSGLSGGAVTGGFETTGDIVSGGVSVISHNHDTVITSGSSAGTYTSEVPN